MTQGLLRALDEIDLLKSNILNFLITTPGATLTDAAIKYGVGRATVYQWQNGDQSFKEATRWARGINRQITNDVVENALLRLIQEKNPAATIFYAKCQMKDRGYIERAAPNDIPDDTPIPLEALPVYDDALALYQENLRIRK